MQSLFAALPSERLLDAIGGFHPLIIHLPIGVLVAVACLEIWIAWSSRSLGRTAIGPLLLLASTGAVVAVVCGLLLSRSGSYDEGLLRWHRYLGFATAAGAFVTWLLHRSLPLSAGRRLTAYRLALTAAIMATLGAGYYGGSIAHGRSPIATLVAALRGVEANADQSSDALQISDDAQYARSIAPILDARCRECHGAEKQEHGLRLDSRAAALAGGKSGKPAIVPGDAMASRLVEAITLPAAHKRAMPPTGKPRLAPGEVVALIDWINRGAQWPDTDGLLIEGVAPVAPEVLDALRANGFRLSQLAVGHPLVRVDHVPRGARLAALAPLRTQIAWLCLDGFALEPGELRILADMPNLTRLELQHSNVQDDDLSDVAKVAHLTQLNLYGTRIGDAGVQHLHALRSLKRIYVWQTAVSADGARQLRAALEGTRVDEGVVETNRDTPPPTSAPPAGLS